MEIRYLGIRHHGPGSAKGVLDSFRRWQPDIILLEIPSDAEVLLPMALDKDLRPPVAILLVQANDLKKASFLPMASFSPEWVALRHGLQSGIPVRAIDLPMSVQFALGARHRLEHEDDPLGQVAALAGYRDAERWWEEQFEFSENPFEAVSVLMDSLRNPEEGSRETLLREAWMRQQIQKAQQEGFVRIAVVCGAWHVPALKQSGKKDKNLLQGLTKVKTQASWAPWTYERLTFSSGYASGVHSPAWYELLFHHPQSATIRWMVRLAQLLRKKGLPSAASQALESVRLAEALAILQNRPTPGLDDLKDAAVCTFGLHGETLYDLIEPQLVVGKASGKVPLTAPRAPLQEDLEAWIKKARLTKEYQSEERVVKSLDLRNENQLIGSRLLHWLSILNIPWGKLRQPRETRQGSFSETWSLKWFPDFVIRLMEAGMWGNTVREAALASLAHEVAQTDDLSVLSEKLVQALHAGLDELTPYLAERLQELASRSRDTAVLTTTFTILAGALRYGDVRQTPSAAIEGILWEVGPRVCAGLPAACAGLDESGARDWSRLILEFHYWERLMGWQELTGLWQDALSRVASQEVSAPLLSGVAARLLIDRGVLDSDYGRRRLRLEMSDREHPDRAAAWLEGFLNGSALMLVYEPTLWQLLDQWVAEMDPEAFREVLPLLRRAFSVFPAAERKRLFEMALYRPDSRLAGAEKKLNSQRSELVGELILQLLK